jgi:Holliday junction resolvasome RuvABC endonuclease subunit
MKRIRVGKLSTTQEVAKFQARVIKKAVKGTGDAINDSYKLCMMASMLAKTLETSDLERRIDALENKSINK